MPTLQGGPGRGRYLIIANDSHRLQRFITEAQAEQAKNEQLKLRMPGNQDGIHAEFVAEMVRQAMVQQYGDEAYTRGLVVTTTLKADAQQAAYKAVRDGVLEYERRQLENR